MLVIYLLWSRLNTKLSLFGLLDLFYGVLDCFCFFLIGSFQCFGVKFYFVILLHCSVPAVFLHLGPPALHHHTPQIITTSMIQSKCRNFNLMPKTRIMNEWVQGIWGLWRAVMSPEDWRLIYLFIICLWWHAFWVLCGASLYWGTFPNKERRRALKQ